MKKRRWTLIGCVLLILSCVWFGAAGEEESQSPYVLYFQEQDLREASGGSALRAVGARLTETDDMTEDEIAVRLLEELLAGPADEALKRTVPLGTALLSFTLENGQAVVDLSSAYGVLSDVGLTLADQSIVLTLTQLPAITSVRITVRGRELEYRDRQVFTGRETLLTPEGDVVSTVRTLLYFQNEAGELVPEERSLGLYEGDTQVETVLEALQNGPESKELRPVLPEDFRVRGVWLEESVCYVNLPADQMAAEVVLAALDASLCALDAVSETRFLVNGAYLEFQKLVE